MEKVYSVHLNTELVQDVEEVETIKFNDGSLSMYNAEGDVVAHFRKDSYQYFCVKDH